ncbi:hypothetical protein BH20ACT23_BH20ACT23_02790 [soil metagenome]
MMTPESPDESPPRDSDGTMLDGTTELSPRTDPAVPAMVEAEPDLSQKREPPPPEGPAGPTPLVPFGARFEPIKVVDVHADQPLRTIMGLERYRMVQALVRFHGTPVGYARIPVVNGRCPAAAQRDAIVQRLGRDLLTHLAEDALGEGVKPYDPAAPVAAELAHPGPSGRLPTITVAVCTRDHPDSLFRCLQSIAALDYPSLDVIVVDNAPSDDSTRAVVTGHFKQMRYVRELRPGLNWARNRAATEARGEVIAYTDDDVVVDLGWVTSLGRAFAEDERVGAVTGLVVPLELETRAQLLFELYGGFGRGFKTIWYRVGPTSKLHVGAGRFGTGANMAFRRTVLQELGGFDPALDVGTVTNGGGDLEMFFRVLQEGNVLLYDPAAIVRHCHRRDYEALRVQLTNHGIGFYSYAVRSVLAYPKQFPSFAWFTGWWLFRWILRRLLVSLARPGRFPRELVLAEWRGAFQGLTRYPRARREAARLEGAGAEAPSGAGVTA